MLAEWTLLTHEAKESSLPEKIRGFYRSRKAGPLADRGAEALRTGS